MDLALEDGFLAGQIFRVILLRECDLDFYVIILGSADKLFFKSRNECAGTDLQRISFCCAAFELLVAYESRVIDQNGISLLNRSVDLDHA